MAIIDSAVLWPNGMKAYFFHHTLYMRYDVASDTTDPGYPLNIQGNWSGL